LGGRSHHPEVVVKNREEAMKKLALSMLVTALVTGASLAGTIVWADFAVATVVWGN
jgi:hypothetical protein